MNKTHILDILQKALAFIQDPANWTKGSYAKDKEAFRCDIHAPIATCFCSIGAVIRANNKTTFDRESPEIQEFTNRLVANIPPACIKPAQHYLRRYGNYYPSMQLVDYNDHPDVTHQDIINLFQTTILQVINEI